MYPQPELSRGAQRKAAVRRSIARGRARCVAAVGPATQPLALLDRVVVLWRQLAPYAGFAAVALSLRRRYAVRPRLGFLARLLRWGPVVVGALRLFRKSGHRR